MPQIYRETGDAPPLPKEGFVEFRLIYDGHLPTNGDAGTKHAIRKYLHPQLRELWSVNRSLCQLAQRHGLPEGAHELSEGQLFDRGIMALSKEYESNNFHWLPLVAERHCLTSSLDILFLRKGGPGGLLKNGDIDGRIKTLFDALQKPQVLSELGGAEPTEDESPFFCLFQNDKLISEVKVTTDRLLDKADRSFNRSSHVHLVITVRLAPTVLNEVAWIFQH